MQNTELLTRMNQMQKELEEIYAAGDPTPIPNYDNSGKLLVELNSILSASVDYSLDFGQVSALNDGYIMCRPINMTFTTNTYAETRAIIDALHNSDFTNQISDISVQFENSGSSGNVQVNLYITYFELKNMLVQHSRKLFFACRFLCLKRLIPFYGFHIFLRSKTHEFFTGYEEFEK